MNCFSYWSVCRHCGIIHMYSFSIGFIYFVVINDKIICPNLTIIHLIYWNLFCFNFWRKIPKIAKVSLVDGKHIYTYTHTRTRPHAHTYTDPHIQSHTYRHISRHTHTITHTYTHIYTHTYTHGSYWLTGHTNNTLYYSGRGYDSGKPLPLSYGRL